MRLYPVNARAASNTISTTPAVFFSIRNARIVNGRTNQGVINILGVSGALKHVQPATLLIYRTAENSLHNLMGNPNFQFYGPVTGMLVDTAATGFTVSSSSQLVWSGELAETGNTDHSFDPTIDAVTLQPGETISVCARTNSGTAMYGSASLDIREDN